MDIINKLSAILATEISNKTSIPTNVQNETNHANLLASYRDLVESYGGKWLYDIGDTNIAIFENPSDAINCALASLSNFKNKQLYVTSAVHLGDVKATSNDIFGNSVNITLSILHATPKDTIYISEMFFGSICYNTAYKTKLVGIKKLKGLQQSATLFEIFESEPNQHQDQNTVINQENISDTKQISRKTEFSLLIALSFIFIYIFHTYSTKTTNEESYTQTRVEILPYNQESLSINASAIRSIIIDNIKEQSKLTVFTSDKYTRKSRKKDQSFNTNNFYSLTIEVQEINKQFFIQFTLIKPDKSAPIMIEKLEANLLNLSTSLNSSLKSIYHAINLNDPKTINYQFASNDLDLIGRYNSSNMAIVNASEKFSPLQSNLTAVEIRLQHCLYLAKRVYKKEIGSTLTANNCSFESVNHFTSQQNLKLASLYYLTNRLSLANQLTNSVLLANPFNYDAMLLKAKIAINTQRYAEAKALLDKLSSFFSNDTQVYQTLATLHLHQGQPELAALHIEESLKFSEDQTDTILNSIPVFKNLGYIDEAILLIESLVNKLNSSQLLFELAELYFLNNNLVMSEDNLIKALKISPNQANYHSKLAETYYFLEDKTNAAYHYNEAIRLFVQKGNKKVARDNAMLALGYARIDKPFKAEDMIKHALKQANNDPEINYLAALVFHHMDKKDIANIYLDHAQGLKLNLKKYRNSPSWKRLANIRL